MKTALFTSLVLALLAAPAALGQTIHHRVDVSIAPALHSLTVTDTLNLPGPRQRFLLHKNLQVRSLTPGSSLRETAAPAKALYKEYELSLPVGLQEIRLQYSGVIQDPVVNNDSQGLISSEGAVLFGSTYWLPDFAQKATFEITSQTLPVGWILASPTAQKLLPQQDIYLIAGPFTEYAVQSGTLLKVYLRQPDPGLAQTFLNSLPGYLDHYQKTLGPYPYDSFAVIENFWETGFGMPGFTLLGPGVIRLPYILNSSLPHELLHNWWGNGVFVDYDRGNWCEGLTTYLADHWQQQVLQTDATYRLQSLMGFQDYTKEAKDFPLRDFKQRFNFSSQAVGYGKGMMFFHMLKLELGEALFQQALKDLYTGYLGQAISYEEIQSSFEKTSGKDLKFFFQQWLDRPGAPGLKILKASLKESGPSKYQVQLELQQTSSQIYELLIPVRFVLADGSSQELSMRLQKPTQIFNFEFSQKPKSLEVDPKFDVFRDLDLQERPVSLSNVFGSSKVWLVGTDTSLTTAYQQAWKNSLQQPMVPSDDKLLLDLPPEGAVVLLGDSPAYEKLMTEQLAGQDFEVHADRVRILGNTYSRADYKIVVTARSLKNPGLVLVWIRGSQLASLAPRLLHYGKFGVLAFAETAAPLKTTWPVLNSPLQVYFK